MAEYRRKWFGKIMDRYRRSSTRIIFVRLPQGPVQRPAVLVVKKSSAIRELTSGGRALMVNEHLFDELEGPEWFGDPIHINVKASARFSKILANELARIMRDKESVQ